MFGRFVLLAGGMVGMCVQPGAVQAQKKGEPAEHSDRITPIVRVVQKCQGAVVAFINPDNGKPMGTGIIVDGRGFIVTNVHVVGENKKVKLQLIDKTELTGNVLSAVGKYDLAIVKINASQDLDAVAPCKTDTVFVGEDVIAIGHPYGYSYSISRGILSATGRKIPLPNGGHVEDVYQTDTAINPGNSGGPLMNVQGELIAINFAVRDDAQNIAFAIPVKRVREVLEKFAK